MPGSIIAAELVAAGVISAGFSASVTAFAINMVASAVISKALASDGPNTGATETSPNPGSRAQIPPAGDNKLPVVYGTAYVGGLVTDLSITSDNQLYLK
jgi:predicted phage tail protein